MKKNIMLAGWMALVVLALPGMSSAASPMAKPFGIRAVQLDLARQMETPSFIVAFAKDAKASGFNTIVLYLEGRIRTPTFPYIPVEESYSLSQMKELASTLTAMGLEVVPVVSVLCHAEMFLKYPELSPLAEERANGGGSRWGGSGCQTFCHSLPGTRVFLEKYLDEVTAIFPGRNFHIGMDEQYNTGFCEKCRPIFNDRTRGLKSLYMDVVLWAHDYLARKGKRVWMWDDFIEFFPEVLSTFPKDIVMCHWNYDTVISRDGCRGHYYERGRRDWLDLYAALGIEAVVCPWAAMPKNVLAMTRHAVSHRVAGGLLTNWEMSSQFHGNTHEVMKRTGKLWQDPAKALMEDPFASLSANVALPDYTASVNPNPLSDAALADDRATWNRFSYLAYDRLPAYKSIAENPNRTDAETRVAEAGTEQLLAEFRRLRPHRAAQQAAWRPNCAPNLAVEEVDRQIKAAEATLAMLRKPIADDVWRLEMSYTLPNWFGSPRFTIYGLIDGEWRELAKGRSKFDSRFEGVNFERTYSFSSKTAPTAVRIDYHGNGVEWVNYMTITKRGVRLVPAKVLAVRGKVLEPEKILKDDWSGTRFGYDDDAVLDPAHEHEHAVLDLQVQGLK